MSQKFRPWVLIEIEITTSWELNLPHTYIPFRFARRFFSVYYWHQETISQHLLALFPLHQFT